MASSHNGLKNDSATASIPVNNHGWNSLVHSLEKIPRRALLSILGPIVLVCIGYVAWQRYGAVHLNFAYYGLTTDSLIVTEKPQWIRSDVTKDVFRGSSLEKLSLLDRQMSATIYKTLSVHTPGSQSLSGSKRIRTSPCRSGISRTDRDGLYRIEIVACCHNAANHF